MDKGGVRNPLGNLVSWGWKILAALLVWGAIGAVVNFVVMPIYTRQGTEIRVWQSNEPVEDRKVGDG